MRLARCATVGWGRGAWSGGRVGSRGGLVGFLRRFLLPLGYSLRFVVRLPIGCEIGFADQHVAEKDREPAVGVGVERQLACEDLGVGVALSLRLPHLGILCCELDRQAYRKHHREAKQSRPSAVFGRRRIARR